MIIQKVIFVVSTAKYSEKEIALFQQIRNSIEDCVYKKINSMRNEKKTASDINVIERECEASFFKEFEAQIKIEQNNCSEFFDQLHQDNTQIYEKIKMHAEQGLRNPNLKEIKCQAIPSSEELAEVYQLGIDWFNKNDFRNAFLYFAYFSIIDSENANAWLARAMTEQNLKRYEDALKSYAISLALNPDNLMTTLNTMNCLILAEHLEEAKQIYEEFTRNVNPIDYEGNDEITSKLTMIKKYINKK